MLNITPSPERDLYRPLQDVPAPESGKTAALPPPAEPGISAALPADQPTIKLGDLCDRLSRDVPGGWKMTEAFVVSFGIKPAESKGRAVLIPEASLPALREALIARVREVLG